MIWEAFNKLAHRNVTAEDMRNMVAWCKKWRVLTERDPLPDESFADRAYIKDGMVTFALAYKVGPEARVYWCYKDGRSSDGGELRGRDAFRCVSQYYKIPKVGYIFANRTIAGRANANYAAASPITYVNKRFQMKKVKAICYDVNSAYDWALLQPIPNTSVPERSGVIEQGKEVGFNCANGRMTAVWQGESFHIFPLMDSPFERFVDTWYKKKKEAKTPKEKAKAKSMLVLAIGYLQLVNPFIRACVIQRCNDLILSLIDNETTVYANTDCVCSTVERPDLKIGDGIGEWKIEHQGEVACKGLNFQWNGGDPVYRSVPRAWFKQWEKQNGRKWDILKDEVPAGCNCVYYDRINKELIIQ